MPNKELKDVPKGKEGNGLRSLPTDVRNNMGYKMDDKVYNMAQIAGKPVMPMNPSDKLYAEDPEDKKIRPLYEPSIFFLVSIMHFLAKFFFNFRLSKTKYNFKKSIIFLG